MVQNASAPVVEMDSAARAVYVRLRRGRVVRTVSPETNGTIVAVDLDKHGQVLGVEILGGQAFKSA